MHLALDELGLYIDSAKITDVESRRLSLYDYLSDEVSKVPPGANGVIFTPWLHGNRCPFEDSNAGGIFFNIRVENGKRDMIRAVLEGICYHLRWLLECEMRKVKTSDTTCQMLPTRISTIEITRYLRDFTVPTQRNLSCSIEAEERMLSGEI